ncbi:hypothetical protein CMUS01_08829 [Colletotrichum musicola]|uniref:RING-type domain-containing protein n=1 Tax=Colletotrichum musicola TaxID=2175873 RepID=A0A8H6NBV6_9PEZI|nr:hypothetical protein CMUS01_08829 [Colletotrichum musicola]
MCIRHTQFFECPSKEGPPKQHQIKKNILCSDNFPCHEAHWEDRHSYYHCMCSGCSGEPPGVPHEKPYQEQWVRDSSQFDAWSQNYIQSLSRAVSLWIWSQHHNHEDRVSTKEMTEMYPAFFYERRCKEENHKSSKCGCEAGGPIDFLYNPAMAVRRHLTNETARALERNPRLQSPDAKEALASVQKSLAVMCQDKSRYFRDGIAREPFFSAQAIERRRQTLARIMTVAWQNVANDLSNSAGADVSSWTDAHTLIESQARRRRGLAKLMGEIILFDSGISSAKFSFVAEKLALLVQMPQWRASSGTLGVEYLVNVVSRTVRTEEPDEPFGKLIAQAVAYLNVKRELWNTAMRSYNTRRMLFEKSTTPISGSALGAMHGGQDGNRVCGFCHVGYWESPSVRSATGRHAMAQKAWPMQLHFSMGDGEPAVRINNCGHHFGRSCLFRYWLAGGSACPTCRTEPLEPVYRLVESATGERLTPSPMSLFIGDR